MVVLNGDILAQASQFSFNDVEVISATIDLDTVWNFRSQISRREQSASVERYFKVDLG